MSDEINLYKQAIEIARKNHEWQKRKDGTMYIDHPLRVAKLLEDFNFPDYVLAVAVLHDTCEDTKLNIQDINSIFWNQVGFVINALSKNHKPKNNAQLKAEYEKNKNKKKISNLDNYTNFEEYIDYRFHLYLNRLYMWIIAEPSVLFIKISDQIDNLSDMKPFSKEKKLRKINEVEKYFLPIYEKAENIFSNDIKYYKIYHRFICMLKDVINQAKLDI